MERKILVGIAAVGLACLVVVALWPKPVDVDVVEVSRGTFRQTVEEDGKTRVRERYTVSAPVAGTLARIDLHPGDAVEPGAVLARLQPLPSPMLDARSRQVAEQRLASARDAHQQSLAAVGRAETALALARSGLDRARYMVSQQAAPALQLEQAEAESRMRESELESFRFAEKVAAHAVQEALSALETFGAKQRSGDQLELTSPVRGRVLHVLRESAGVVAAGETLIELGDPESLEVVVQVLSQDAVALRPGMTATLTHWGADQQLHAHVRRVEPAAFTHLSALGVEEQRVNVVLDLDDPSAGSKLLGDGFAVEAQNPGVGGGRSDSGPHELALPPGRWVGRVRRAFGPGEGAGGPGRPPQPPSIGDPGRPRRRRPGDRASGSSAPGGSPRAIAVSGRAERTADGASARLAARPRATLGRGRSLPPSTPPSRASHATPPSKRESGRSGM